MVIDFTSLMSLNQAVICMGVCPGLSPCQGLPLARDNEATGTNLGMRGVSPTPTVLTQNSRRAFPQDYRFAVCGTHPRPRYPSNNDYVILSAAKRSEESLMRGSRRQVVWQIGQPNLCIRPKCRTFLRVAPGILRRYASQNDMSAWSYLPTWSYLKSID